MMRRAMALLPLPVVQAGSLETSGDPMLSPNGTRVALVSDEGMLQIHDVAARRVVHSIPAKGVRLFGWSSDGEQLLGLGEDTVVRTWLAADGSEQRLFTIKDREPSALLTTISLTGAPPRTSVGCSGRWGRMGPWPCCPVFAPQERRSLAEPGEVEIMDQRTNRFLAGANLAAHWLFREIAPTLESRVLRVAIPWDSLPPQAEPIVEHHEDFPKPCWDVAFLNDLRELGRLDPASRSTER